MVGDPRHRVVAGDVFEGAGRQLGDLGDGAALAVIEPVLDEIDDGLAAIARQQLGDPLAATQLVIFVGLILYLEQFLDVVDLLR